MRLRALASIGVSLCTVSLAGQVSDARLDRAVERIERNDAGGLRRLLSDDPSLVQRTGAGVLPHWRWTLLHKATAGMASLDVVRALVDAGSDVNAHDNEGNTPLHFAVKRINREKFPTRDYEGIIRLLLEKKADVHIVNIAGATPLHTASAFRADPPAVEMLIQAGADVNLKTLPSHGGWTPLHGAVARNSAGIATVLLKYGADLSVRDSRELRPIHVAVRGGFDETVNVIRAYAAARTANSSGVVPTVYVPPAAGLPASIGGVVQGRVLWNDRPVAGATVDVADIPRHGSAHYGTTTTDDQGRFSVHGVPPGDRYIDVKGDQRLFMITGSGEPFVTSERSTRTVRRLSYDLHVCKNFDLDSPAHNESVGSRPTLRWNAYPDARRFVVDVFDRTSSIAREWIVDASVTSVQIDADLPPGSYEWRVNAVNATARAIGCSVAPRGFLVEPRDARAVTPRAERPGDRSPLPGAPVSR
jgi:Ankyrin repeats (3 copies)/Ankyrin repeat